MVGEVDRDGLLEELLDGDEVGDGVAVEVPDGVSDGEAVDELVPVLDGEIDIDEAGRFVEDVEATGVFDKEAVTDVDGEGLGGIFEMD